MMFLHYHCYMYHMPQHAAFSVSSFYDIPSIPLCALTYAVQKHCSSWMNTCNSPSVSSFKDINLETVEKKCSSGRIMLPYPLLLSVRYTNTKALPNKNCLISKNSSPPLLFHLNMPFFISSSETTLHIIIGVKCQMQCPPGKIHGNFTSMRSNHSSVGAMSTETHH